MMTEDSGRTRRTYQAYLLRLWQVESGSLTAWRASLEDTHTGERCGFADLEALFEFIKEHTDEPLRPPA